MFENSGLTRGEPLLLQARLRDRVGRDLRVSGNEAWCKKGRRPSGLTPIGCFESVGSGIAQRPLGKMKANPSMELIVPVPWDFFSLGTLKRIGGGVSARAPLGEGC